MRVKDYAERDGKRVWLAEREIQRLLGNADANHTEARFALRLMARSGLRRKEVVDVRFIDVVEDPDTGDLVKVRDGKGGKYREPPAPEGFRREVDVYRQATGRDADAAIVDADPSTLYDWVARARDRCRAETGEDRWRFVGPHDLRRSWGVRLLESGVLPSVVMEWGGWDDWETFRNHYLAEFSPEALRRERGKVEWLSELPSDDAAGGYTSIAGGPR